MLDALQFSIESHRINVPKNTWLHTSLSVHVASRIVHETTKQRANDDGPTLANTQSENRSG